MLKPRIEISIKDLEGETLIYCDEIWEGQPLDRPSTGGMYLSNNKRGMVIAQAYQKAVADGKIYTNPKIVRDNGGKTYVSHDGFVMAKYLASDLRKLGYLR